MAASKVIHHGFAEIAETWLAAFRVAEALIQSGEYPRRHPW